ncbi:MAG: endonuclease/exonuclease/phosphatase family protein [Rhodoglobus sp.]
MFRRVLAAAALLIAAAALLVAAWPQLFGLQKTPVIAQLVSVRGLAVVVAIIAVIALTLLALLSRSARRFLASLAVILLVFCAVSVAVLSTRGFGNTAFQTTNSSDVTVLTWNTLGDEPGAQAVARLAIDSGADIVTLPETTNGFGNDVAIIMAQAGRPMYVYTVSYDLISKARSTTLLVSADLGTYDVDKDARTTSTLPSIVATPRDGFGPVIVAVHPVAPIPGEMSGWRSDLTWLATACGGDNVIMAGDFNSTTDHYGGLATSPGATIGNCADAGLATGNGAVGTWPTVLPALLGAPIDHVMFTPNWHVTGMRVVQNEDGAGSDHRPVIVQLSPTS